MDRKVTLGARSRGTFVVDDGSVIALDTGAHGHRPALPLSVVVVSYRSPDLVADCVAALGGSTLRPAEIVVVDTDPEGDRALDRDTVVGLSEIPTRIEPVLGNPGYAAASNRGAAATTAPWVLFMNADVTVETGCLETVFAEASLDDEIDDRDLRPATAVGLVGLPVEHPASEASSVGSLVVASDVKRGEEYAAERRAEDTVAETLVVD